VLGKVPSKHYIKTIPRLPPPDQIQQRLGGLKAVRDPSEQPACCKLGDGVA
jgi:hypothetical protein